MSDNAYEEFRYSGRTGEPVSDADYEKAVEAVKENA